MKHIYAVSYLKFKDLIKEHNITNETVNQRNTAFIQILCTDNGEEFVLNNNDNVLSLRFDDIDEPLDLKLFGEEYVQVYPMSEVQADHIVEFVEKNKDKETFIVHCMAGVSRSGGVTRWISEHFKQSNFAYREENPYVKPNQRIINLLRKAKLAAGEQP